MIVLNYEEYILSLHGFVYACACIVCVWDGEGKEEKSESFHVAFAHSGTPDRCES